MGVSTTKFTSHNGHVTKLHANRVKFEGGKFVPMPIRTLSWMRILCFSPWVSTGPVRNGFPRQPRREL